jgi:Arc/MetJ family transcription regulator
MTMVRRTSLNLDFELVAEARAALGTNGTTETVHKALEDAVRQFHLNRLANRVFDFDNDELERTWSDVEDEL